jgi:hypothetical protein
LLTLFSADYYTLRLVRFKQLGLGIGSVDYVLVIFGLSGFCFVCELQRCGKSSCELERFGSVGNVFDRHNLFVNCVLSFRLCGKVVLRLESTGSLWVDRWIANRFVHFPSCQ